MASLTDLRVEREQTQALLDEIAGLLKNEPTLKVDYENILNNLAIIDKAIEEQGGNSNVAGLANASPAPVPSVETKASGTTPVGSDAASKTAAAAMFKPVFNVNDKVSAKWHEDRSFYPARIVSVTGSKADPVYTVMFDGYKDTATLRAHQLRELNSKKRKADTSGPPSPPKSVLPTSKPTNVISAASTVKPALVAEVRKEAGKTSDDARRPAKISKKMQKSIETFDRKQGDWKSFSNKRMKGMKGMKNNGTFRPNSERTKPEVDTNAASRPGLSRYRPKFDDPDSVEA